jgi:hypothetical protein
MSNVKVTLAIGIALTVAVGAFVLTRSPPRVVRTNGVQVSATLAITQGEFAICQSNEVLPADVTAVRVSIVGFLGSDMQAVIYRGGRALTAGRHNPNWSGTSVTIPVEPLNRATSGVRLCVAFAPNSEVLQLFGQSTSAQNGAVSFPIKQLTSSAPSGAGTPLKGKLEVAYLASGRGSWWSRAATVATHMGLGHFIGGKWIVLLVIVLMAAVGVLTVRLTLREQP